MGDFMYYFIVNVSSRTGKAKKIWEKVQQELKKREVAYEAYLTEYKGHATELAKKLTAEAGKRVSLIVVGGDGTANEVLNGICDFNNTEIGLIPTGSGNDLGRGLGLSGALEEQLDRILVKKQLRQVDLGEVSWDQGAGKRIFAISSGIGLDAQVCKKALNARIKKVLNAMHLGSLTYVFLTVETLFTMQTARVEIDYPDGRVTDLHHMICTAVMNLPYEGGGVPMAPDASFTDGKLSICSISEIPKWRTFFCLPRLVCGKQEGIQGFRMKEEPEFMLRLDKKMIVHADGEDCGMHSELTYRCLSGALHLIG